MGSPWRTECRRGARRALGSTWRDPLIGESGGKSSASLLGLKRTQAHSAALSLRLVTWRGQSSRRPAPPPAGRALGPRRRRHPQRGEPGVGRLRRRLPGRARRVPRRRPASSGARRAWTRRTSACSVTSAAGDVLEVGCGAAQCSRWLVSQGADAVGVDLSSGSCSTPAASTTEPGIDVAVVLADAVGAAVPGRELRPRLLRLRRGAVRRRQRPPDARGGAGPATRRPLGVRVNHPVRWVLPDDPGPEGLVARTSYWDRRPYVERDESGAPTYVEHHRTLGDRVREVVAAGTRAGGPDRAGVAGGSRPGLGRLVAAAGRAAAGHGHLRLPQARGSRHGLSQAFASTGTGAAGGGPAGSCLRRISRMPPATISRPRMSAPIGR